MAPSVYTTCAPDAASREVRVVLLQPSKDPSAALHCHFDIRRLAEPPAYATPSEYTALSYSWLLTGRIEDEPLPRKVIHLSVGAVHDTIEVGHNLYCFLETARHAAETKTLWIDALCINQDAESHERALFVPMMDQIYRSAQETIIWLGPGSEDSELAMATVNTFAIQQFADANVLLNPRDPHWVAVRRLLRRNWWGRLWVLQEALLSRSATVHCGDSSAPLAKFINLDAWERSNLLGHITEFGGLQLFNDGCPISSSFRSWAADQKRLWSPSEGEEGLRMHEWISWTSRLGCREQLDRVYALLGLVDRREREAIRIKYDNALIPQVFSQAAKTSFLHRGLETFSHGYVHERTGVKIPSWVPDWSGYEEHVPLFGWPKIRSDDGFRWPSPLECHEWWNGVPDWDRDSRVEDERSIGCSLNDETQQLGVKVLVFDRIVYHDVNPAVPIYGGLDLDQYARTRQARRDTTIASCRRWEEHVQGLTSEIYGTTVESRKEAFWRTLMCNRTFDWQAQPETAIYAPLFERWIRQPLSQLPPAQLQQLAPFHNCAVSRCSTRAFATTEHGWMGLVPGKAKVGDWVCLLKGGTVPYILREGPDDANGKAEWWEFVGEAYIHGLMYGMILERMNVADVQEIWLS